LREGSRRHFGLIVRPSSSARLVFLAAAGDSGGMERRQPPINAHKIQRPQSHAPVRTFIANLVGPNTLPTGPLKVLSL